MLSKIKLYKNKIMTVALSASLVASAAVFSSAAAPSIVSVFSGETPDVDLMTVLDEVVALVPYVLPAIIGFIALRKGISFVKHALKGA